MQNIKKVIYKNLKKNGFYQKNGISYNIYNIIIVVIRKYMVI